MPDADRSIAKATDSTRIVPVRSLGVPMRHRTPPRPDLIVCGLLRGRRGKLQNVTQRFEVNVLYFLSYKRCVAV